MSRAGLAVRGVATPFLFPALLPRAAEPTSEEAHRLLQEELNRLAYQQESLVDKVIRWISDRLDALAAGPGDAAPSGLSTWVTVLVSVLVVALLAWVLPKVQRERRVRARQAGVFDDSTSTAADYRTRARSALNSGDPATAVLDGFRALARGMTERTLVTDAPGLTADEIALALQPRFPPSASDLVHAAALFDQVRYGGQIPDVGSATWLLDLEDTLRQTRPVLDHSADALAAAAPAASPTEPGR